MIPEMSKGSLLILSRNGAVAILTVTKTWYEFIRSVSTERDSFE